MHPVDYEIELTELRGKCEITTYFQFETRYQCSNSFKTEDGRLIFSASTLSTMKFSANLIFALIFPTF